MERTREQIEQELAEAREALESFEVSDHITEGQYDEWLDEVCGPVNIGSLTYEASMVLKEVDPTAYRCGMNDYADSLSPEDFEEYQEIQARVEELEEELEDLDDDD